MTQAFHKESTLVAVRAIQSRLAAIKKSVNKEGASKNQRDATLAVRVAVEALPFSSTPTK